jgi:hypothetical protein
MGGFKLINVGAPAAGGDAANRTYVDTQEALDLRLDGTRPMTGALNMNTHLINNVVNPVSPQDAATKFYVDAGDAATLAAAEAYSDLHDRFAATRVVDPTGVAGTDSTLAAAIAALPASGGVIFLKQGTYTISTTQVLPNKDVMIIGAGIGATTIMFTGTGNFFTSAFGTHYVFKNLFVDGGALNTAQTFLTTTGTVTDVYFIDVEISGFNHIVNDTGGNTNTFTFENVEMDLPAIDGTSSFYNGVASSTVVWNYTSVTLAEVSRIGAGGGAFLGSPKWVVDHSYIGTPTVFISDFVIGQAIFDGLRADNIKFTISGARSQIYGLESTDCIIVLSANDCFINHSLFRRVNGFSGSGNSFITTSGADEIHVADSTFDGGGTDGNSGLTLTGVTHLTINGNRFRSLPSNGISTNAAAVGTVTGNTFTSVTTPVSETSASAAITYSNNSGFASSSIAGAGSTVDGFLRKDVVGGTTTDPFVDQFTHVNTKGLSGAGSIKNTGGSNTLTVRITATDAYGTTDTQVADVLPGAAAAWSMLNAVGTALPTYVSYAVGVKSTSTGNSTTFTLHHATTGAY